MSLMLRVSKKNPCVKCGKFDWCIYGKSLAICMRVLSDRQKVFADGSVGYIHPLDGKYEFKPESRKSETVKPSASIPVMMGRYRRNAGPEVVKAMARSLGVSEFSLQSLDCGRRDKYTWAFPMRNAANDIVGIRLRTDGGKKFAETGSHQGLFLPQMRATDTVFFVEGPTDTAAALTIGAYAIGRPSSNGGVYELVAAIKRLKIRRAVIVADNDEDKQRPDGSHYNPGFDGAAGLQEHLPIPSCVLALPAKDMRKFVISGGNLDVIEALLSQVIWRQP